MNLLLKAQQYVFAIVCSLSCELLPTDYARYVEDVNGVVIRCRFIKREIKSAASPVDSNLVSTLIRLITCLTADWKASGHMLK